MEENKQNFNNGSGPWWKSGVQILSEISTWIVVPIVLALVFGKMLDAHYGTKPKFFILLAGIGFLVTCFGMYKATKNYIDTLKDIDPASHKATEGEEKN